MKRFIGAQQHREGVRKATLGLWDAAGAHFEGMTCSKVG